MVSLSADNLQLIVQDNQSAYFHRIWQAPVGHSNDKDYRAKGWSEWTSIGDGQFTTEPVVCKWGRDFFVFGLDMHFALKYRRYNGTTKKWHTDGWIPLGTGTEKWLNKPGTVAAYPDWIELVIIGEDRALYQFWFNGTTQKWSNSSRWNSTILFKEPPVLTTWGRNRLDIFCVAADGKLYTSWWSKEKKWEPNDGKATFSELGGGPFPYQVQAISTEPGYIDLLVVGSDSKVHHRRYNGVWGEWTTVDVASRMYRGVPEIISFVAGQIDALVIDADGRVNQLTHSLETGWSSAGPISKITTADRVSAVSWGPGRFDLLFNEPNGSIGHQIYYTDAGWPADLTESLGLAQGSRSRVATDS